MEELKKCPCNIGDTVYNKCPTAQGIRYREDVIDKIIINRDGVVLHFETGLMKNINCIGDSLLLSEGEAIEVWNRRVK